MSRRDKEVVFSGLSGTDGRYPFPRTTIANLAALARGEKIEEGVVKKIQIWLKKWFDLKREGRDGVDEAVIEQAGWGVVFPRECDHRIREALRPLLDWRKNQASILNENRYREYWDKDGYWEGDSRRTFFERHNVDVGAADPDRMPYYLLLVGGPEEIPFDFQYELDLRHAVGRLDFDTLEEYAAYAQSVIAKEKEWIDQDASVRRRAAFFCPLNADDASFRLRHELVGSLLGRLETKPEPGWQLDTVLDDQATKEALLGLLGGPHRPDFIFTACHGLVFDPSDPYQREKQGALACQSRGGGGLLGTSVSASDVSAESSPQGLISFHFACYSAGTPRWDEYSRNIDRKPRAPKPFTSRLSQRLLGHPNGGALAVIGHVERAWTYSFEGARTTQVNVFEDTVRRILQGDPVGLALELFNLRHADLSAELLSLREREELEPMRGKRDWDLADAYCATRDARNYVVLGDPAVRLSPVVQGAYSGGSGGNA